MDKPESTGLQDTAGNKLRIAVAKDAAFCFLYEDNLEYLRANGCELVFFSPLSDKKLPEKIDGLLLYGGYPESRYWVDCRVLRNVADFYICMKHWKHRKKNVFRCAA